MLSPWGTRSRGDKVQVQGHKSRGLVDDADAFAFQGPVLVFSSKSTLYIFFLARPSISPARDLLHPECCYYCCGTYGENTIAPARGFALPFAFSYTAATEMDAFHRYSHFSIYMARGGVEHALALVVI